MHSQADLTLDGLRDILERLKQIERHTKNGMSEGRRNNEINRIGQELDPIIRMIGKIEELKGQILNPPVPEEWLAAEEESK